MSADAEVARLGKQVQRKLTDLKQVKLLVKGSHSWESPFSVVRRLPTKKNANTFLFT